MRKTSLSFSVKCILIHFMRKAIDSIATLSDLKRHGKGLPLKEFDSKVEEFIKARDAAKAELDAEILRVAKEAPSENNIQVLKDKLESVKEMLKVEIDSTLDISKVDFQTIDSIFSTGKRNFKDQYEFVIRLKGSDTIKGEFEEIIKFADETGKTDEAIVYRKRLETVEKDFPNSLEDTHVHHFVSERQSISIVDIEDYVKKHFVKL